jgi:hypothetical protein
MSSALRNIVRSPFLWFLVFLVCAETFAATVSPYRDTPPSGQSRRNRFGERGWPEYLQSITPQRKPLIIIISNSQGVGREIRDPADLYAARLEKKLNAENIPAQVENWSCSGLRTTEIELLSIRAAQRRPDLVIFIMTYKNLDAENLWGLNYPSSDIPLLAGDPSFWPYFSDTLFMEKTTPHDILKNFFYLQSRFLRGRFFFYDRLEWSLTRQWQLIIFGKEWRRKKNNSTIDFENYAQNQPFKRGAYLSDAAAPIRLGLGPDSFIKQEFTFSRLYPTIHRRLTQNNASVLWVWSPVAWKTLQSVELKKMENFYERCDALIKAEGGDSLDLTRSLTNEYFFNLSHLDSKGHELLSEKLAAKVIRAIQ